MILPTGKCKSKKQHIFPYRLKGDFLRKRGISREKDILETKQVRHHNKSRHDETQKEYNRQHQKQHRKR